MKGYKVMSFDMKCKDFQYEVGKTYTTKKEIFLCNHGFHFCVNPSNCFNYYSFNANNIVCEIKALGKIIEGDDKSVTNKIKIIRK